MLELMELSIARQEGNRKQTENGQRSLISEVFREAGCSASSCKISKISPCVSSWKNSTPSLSRAFGGRVVGGHC